jgi:type II secretory pathway predicted ATPase ExeA
MYESHFGFHRQPFQSAGTDQSFFESACVREVVPQILHTLRSDLGMAVLTGPGGSGRTTALRHIQSLLAREGRPVLCSGACLNAPGHLDTLLFNASQQLAGAPGSSPAKVSSKALLPSPSLTDLLRKSSEFWGPVFLLIDDAHLVPAATLNEIRAMTEDVWNGRSMVRCLASGPLSFEEDLARPDHMDFSRRIRCHVFLKPLNSRESVDFLDFQIAAAGGRLAGTFTKTALELIVQASDGLPRCLSLLADESLLQACREKQSRVGEDTVRKALSHLQHLPYAWSVSPRQDDSDEMPDHAPTESINIPAARSEAPPVNRSSSDSMMYSATNSIAVVEFGSSGVIEVGGPQSEPPRALEASASPPAPHDISILETPANEPAATVSESHIEIPDDAHKQQPGDLRGVLFEIGNRYATSRTLVDVPDAIDAEATDFVDVTDCVDLLNEFPDESSVSAVEIGLTYSQPAMASESEFEETQAVSNSQLEMAFAALDSTDGITGECAADEVLQLEGAAVFANLTGNALSQRIPVFDRYTWLSLGREVPSGGYSVSSSSRLKQPFSEALPHDVTSMPWNDEHSPVFTGRIPVSTVSDSEILAQLHLAELEPELHGIVEFPISAGNQWQTEQLAARGFQIVVTDEGTENEHLGASELQPSYSIASIESEGEADSGTDVAVEEFQRPSLFVRNAMTELRSLNRPDASWRDGQLVFGEMPWAVSGAAKEAIFSTQEISPHTDLNTDSCPSASIAEVVAAAPINSPDSDARPTLDTSALPSLPSVAETPGPLLSSELLSSDDVLPLARSLAELQDEVTSFHESTPDRQRDNRFDQQSGREATSVFHAEALTPQASTTESLVSQARHRLMEDPADTNACLHSETLVHTPSAPDSMACLLSDCESESSEFKSESGRPIRLTQLFTRLRQKKCSN